MDRDYLIAIGGTGSRCMEAVTYLAAAGLFQKSMHVLIIDPDQSNGNSSKARSLVTNYHALYLAHQPGQAERKRKIGWAKMPKPKLLQASINLRRNDPVNQHSIFWHNPNIANRRFGDVIDYQGQSIEFKQFLDLFYEPADLEMVLDVGYRGRTNVGAVALKQDLEKTTDLEGSGLREFLEDLNMDLQAGEARVFVMGSVFGGTGAAGLPTIPKLIAGLGDKVIARDNRTRIRYGCAMMAPYFSFPKGSADNTGPGTDSAGHAIATQAALLHYAHVPPGYQHVYFVGAPARPQTNDNNVVGGEDQVNDPHYAELIAALSAWQFFGLKEVRSDDHQLHFADTILQGKKDKKEKRDLGLSWETLPLNLEDSSARDRIKRELSAFTTLVYFYTGFLHDRFIANHEYHQANWYRNNFSDLSLDEEVHQLQQLNEFSKSYLGWLAKIGETGKSAKPQLFNWDALLESDQRLAANHIGNLLDDRTTSNAKRSDAGFNDLYAKLDGLKVRQPGTDSATGLFIYMLHHAVREFCRANYAWPEEK